MDTLRALTDKIVTFRDARDWKQFHTPKDMVLSLLLEAAELAEHMQWRQGDALQDYLKDHQAEVGEELSDVLYWVLLLAHDLKLDLPKAFAAKMQRNEEKYPVERARGSHAKYRDL